MVSEHRDTDLSLTQIRAVVALTDQVWPGETGETLDEQVAAFLEKRRTVLDATTDVPLRYVVWEAGRAVAHAKTFARTVFTDGGSLRVLALAGVCTAPSHRRRGLGAAVVRRAFDRVDQGDFPVSVFQTPVPGFYEKLGARAVFNRFINTRNEAAPERNPWHDDHVMIYPHAYPWPGGVIDLNGPGY